jgi:hypothetical protein
MQVVGFAMPESRDDEQYSEAETEQRLQKILQGAFAGPPTPLKNVPTKAGKPRITRLNENQGSKQGARPECELPK